MSWIQTIQDELAMLPAEAEESGCLVRIDLGPDKVQLQNTLAPGTGLQISIVVQRLPGSERVGCA